MTPHDTWTEEELTELRKLHKDGLSNQEKAATLTEIFGLYFSKESVKKKLQRLNKSHEPNEKMEYKDTIEIMADGSHKSDKLLRMSANQSKDVDYLLEAHGYDKNAWELVSARSNIWNVYSKIDKVQQLYASKITVKPKLDQGYHKLIESMKHIQPVKVDIEPLDIIDKYLLEISYLDTHFGISNYEYYSPTQRETIDHINKRIWEQTLITIGQDLFHNDDFRGRTASGREIQTVDMSKAWGDARRFYEPIIEESLKRSKQVKILYSKGNHDESMSWAFVQMLKARYPQCYYDDSFTERKVHTFGNNFIGITHGDKGRKDIHNIFPVEFPLEWANATCREIHMGHFHVEDLRDKFGTRVRTLATRNKTDQWHKDNGYVGAHKEFMLFEYNTDKLKAIHYV